MALVKNTAGQEIGAQMVSATDGSAFTGSVTVSVTVDAGTQATGSVGSGACTHEGNGYHTYAPAQAETNGTLIAFTFTGSGAVPVTVQCLTVGYDPTQTVVPANTTQIAGTSVTLAQLGVMATGTAAAIAAGTITLAGSHGITNTRVLVVLTGGTNALGKSRVATYSGSGDVFSVSPPWNANGETTPSGTITYAVLPYPRSAEDDAIDSGLVLAQGTIGDTGNDSTHLHLTGLTFGDDELNDRYIVVLDVSAGERHIVPISDWVNATALATVGTLPFTPEDDVDRYWVLAQVVASGSGLDAAGTRAALGMSSANLDTQLAAIQSTADAVETDTQDIQSRIPAALVGGRIDATVDGTGMEAGAVSAIAAGLNDLDATAVQSAAAAALTAYDPPTRAEATADKDEVLGVLGTPAGADLSADIAAVKSDSAAILTDTGTTLDGKLDAIQAVTDALPDAGALTSIAQGADLATLDGKVDTLVAADDDVFKKNVAKSNIPIYMQLTDGSPGTGLTVTVQISKDGGSFTTIAGSVTEVSDGWYTFSLSQTEMNADTIAVKATATGAAQRNVAIITEA